MTEQSPELEPTPLEPQQNFAPEPTEEDRETFDNVSGPSSVEFSVDDVNRDYAKGVFLRHARALQAEFVQQYDQDPSATFRLTLDKL